MKYRVFTFLMSCFCSVMTLQAQDIMVVEKTDNSTLEINVDDIRQVTFRTQQKSVILSSTNLDLMTGFGGRIHIQSGSGNYSIVDNSNPDVATASLEKNDEGSTDVLITGLNPGKTTITITDNETGLTSTLTIIVSDEAKPLTGGSYVDMGLASRTLWASCNVGASLPEEYGWYVSWGETAEKERYSTADYTLVSSGNTWDLTDGYDVACVTLGDKWRMPTQTELEELFTCTWSWEKRNGVQGVRITGPNGNAIFLPAATFKDDSRTAPTESSYGSYWGRTHADPSYPCGSELIFGIVDPYGGWNKTNFYYSMGKTGFVYCGRSVRPVYDIQRQYTDVDYTSFIANPNYDGNNFSWWQGTAFSGLNPDNNAEHFNKNYDTYQTVSGLPAGNYRVGVQGFYRRGNYPDDYALWQAGDNGSKNALLYATTESGTSSVPLVVLSSAALSSSLGGRAASVGEGLYVPDDMVAAGKWFAAGYYKNYLDVTVGADGNLTIGIKKDTLIDKDWTIIDNWTLTRIQ